jgi:hypothetical protein
VAVFCCPLRSILARRSCLSLPCLPVTTHAWRAQIWRQRTAAARAEKEKSPGHPNKSAIIQFDIDDSPTSLNSPGEAVSMDNLKAVQKKLARETEMKEQALAELKVNDDVCQLAGGRVQSQAVCYKLAIVTRALPLGTTASARHTRTD